MIVWYSCLLGLFQPIHPAFSARPQAGPSDEDEQESYYEPEASPERATVYEHCARALDRSLADYRPAGAA